VRVCGLLPSDSCMGPVMDSFDHYERPWVTERLLTPQGLCSVKLTNSWTPPFPQPHTNNRTNSPSCCAQYLALQNTTSNVGTAIIWELAMRRGAERTGRHSHLLLRATLSTAPGRPPTTAGEIGSHSDTLTDSLTNQPTIKYLYIRRHNTFL
jgi:hypothetical protein